VSLSIPKVYIRLARPFEAEFYSYSLTSIGSKLEDGVQSKRSEEYQVNSNHPFEYVTLFHSFDSGAPEEDANDGSDRSLEWAPPDSPSRAQVVITSDSGAQNNVLSGLTLIKVDPTIDSPEAEQDSSLMKQAQEKSKRRLLMSASHIPPQLPAGVDAHYHEEHLNIRSGPPCPPSGSLEIQEEELGFDRELMWEDADSNPILEITKSILDIEKMILVFRLWERLHDSDSLTEVGSCHFSVLPLLKESIKAWPLLGGGLQAISTCTEEDLYLRLKHRGAVEAGCTLRVASFHLDLYRLSTVL
jgi:hypothetical protein